MATIRTETVKKTSGVQFAPGGPQYDGYGLFATADILFWNLCEGGSDYSLSHKEPIVTALTPAIGKAKHATFDWDFGFRAGAGYNFEHDAWDAYLNFTWFQTEASNTAHAPSNGGLSPQKGPTYTIDAPKIHSHWHVHYYVLDLELGRRFFVSKYLSLRPQFGIEAAWINQRRKYSIPVTPPITGETLHGKNHFSGVGPRAGIEGMWYFGRHFSLLGAINGALQWGRFATHTKETVQTTSGKVPSATIHDNFQTLVPNAQMKLGIGWDANIMQDRFHLGINLNYEFQYWWRQNQFINEPFETVSYRHESMDLSINGLTLDFRFDF